MKKIAGLLTLVILSTLAGNVFAEEWKSTDGLFGMERRRDQFAKDFAYFIYPIVGSVPGLGSAAGGGATATNLMGTDTDVTGFYVKGDFEATGAALLNLHLLPERLLFNAAYYNAKVAPQQFRRGADSSKDDYILPVTESDVLVGQLALSFYERMFEVYARYAAGSFSLSRVLDSEGNEFANIDTGVKGFRVLNIGLTLDITDDVQDPRKGVRFEANRQTPFFDDPLSSKFDVYNYNLTGYLPVGKQSAWAFNAFFSQARITSQATTDREELRRESGLRCESIADPAERTRCEQTENQFLDEAIAGNRFGRATALGGTQRLRSYPNGRFYAGNAVFCGTELRWNVTEERTLMDWLFLRGLRTNLQLAFFAGTGGVADHTGDLHRDMRSSYGVGFRLLFSGVTIRLDYAIGDEGDEFQFFIDYPWSMFSVDNPV